MHAGIASNNPTAVEAAYKRLLATITTDDGPDAVDYLDPETLALYQSFPRTRQSSQSMASTE